MARVAGSHDAMAPGATAAGRACTFFGELIHLLEGAHDAEVQTTPKHQNTEVHNKCLLDKGLSQKSKEHIIAFVLNVTQFYITFMTSYVMLYGCLWMLFQGLSKIINLYKLIPIISKIHIYNCWISSITI